MKIMPSHFGPKGMALSGRLCVSVVRAMMIASTVFLTIAKANSGEKCADVSSTIYSDIDLYVFSKNCNAVGSYVDKNVFCLIGEITSESVRQFNAAKDIRILVIDSGGGSLRAAIALGKEIFARKTLSIIRDRCYSSCANYIFLASEHKVLLPNAGVFWHGSPKMAFRDRWSGRWDDKNDPLRPSDLVLHDEFLELFDPKERSKFDSIMSIPPNNMSVEDEVNRLFWHYADGELCSKFGVKNIYRLKKKSIYNTPRKGFSSYFNTMQLFAPRKNKL